MTLDSEAELLVGGLQRRELGLRPYPDEATLLVRFDAADIATKRRMLGSYAVWHVRG